ncbi:conserved hypothetical protein [Trichinella spiralis]|uniref:hypothetical protein n=1 Tax=Trichinella spiralis TaxID=6334 RepID=UPI0001EFE41D|nr:conserved hypothetical protein [Trichinella spiralis]
MVKIRRSKDTIRKTNFCKNGIDGHQSIDERLEEYNKRIAAVPGCVFLEIT